VDTLLVEKSIGLLIETYTITGHLPFFGGCPFSFVPAQQIDPFSAPLGDRPEIGFTNCPNCNRSKQKAK
jgi:hypothetical protein